jgi:hypothetical protein
MSNHAIAECEQPIINLRFPSHDTFENRVVTLSGELRVVLGSRYALRVKSICAPKFVNYCKSASGQRHIQEKFAIPTNLVINAKPACSIKYLPSKKGRGLHEDNAAINKAIQRHSVGIEPPQEPLIGPNQVAMPAYHVNAFVPPKVAHCRSDRPGQQEIVGI